MRLTLRATAHEGVTVGDGEWQACIECNGDGDDVDGHWLHGACSACSGEGGFVEIPDGALISCSYDNWERDTVGGE